mgnify:CR=1 FL=1
MAWSKVWAGSAETSPHPPDTGEATETATFERKPKTERKNIKLKPGKLADLAPTMLDIMGLEKPKEMTGETLLVRE